MNKTMLLHHIKEVAGKIAELQAAVEQFPDITEEQLARPSADQDNPGAASDRQPEILFVDKHRIQLSITDAGQ